jgi:hypothetical protein
MNLRSRVAAVAVAAAMMTAAGCTGPGAAPEATPPTADISASGPDCLADEVLTGMGVAAPTTPTRRRPAPSSGSVPVGFTAVQVVECRPLLPGGAPPTRGALSSVVLEVVLTGDLTPLLAALSRPSDAPIADGACPAMFQLKPQIYLVDAAGRAVRPQWPLDRCGFLQDGALAALSGLSEVSSTEHVVELQPVEADPCTRRERMRA